MDTFRENAESVLRTVDKDTFRENAESVLRTVDNLKKMVQMTRRVMLLAHGGRVMERVEIHLALESFKVLSF